MTGQKHTGTSIVREYPGDEGDPFFPIPSAGNQMLYRKYKELAASEPFTCFVGRLAEYRYYQHGSSCSRCIESCRADI